MNVALILLAGLIFAGGNEQGQPIKISVWAAQASQENRPEKFFDAGLEAIRPAVSDLPFDTFKKVMVSNASAVFAQEARFTLDDKYTLYVTPLSRETDGRIRLDIRVEMQPKEPGGKPIKALATRMIIAEKEKVKFRGLKRDAGELIVVLAAGT